MFGFIFYFLEQFGHLNIEHVIECKFVYSTHSEAQKNWNMSLEQRKLCCRPKQQREQVAHAQKTPRLPKVFQQSIKKKKKFFFCVGVEPVNNVVIVSGEFQVNNEETLPYIYMYLFSKLPSYPGCHITLSRVPCARQ